MPDDFDSFDDNVVPFPRGQFEKAQNERESALDELDVRTKRELRPCKHERSVVDEAARTLTCRDCAVALDPIAALTTLARRRERLVEQGRRLRSERDYLAEEVEKLKRQERNAKSRIRSARRRRDDREALIAAAKAGVSVGSYRPWDQCSEPQQGVVLEKVRTVIEAYLGALARAEAERETA